jgi:hypothetical protein
MSSEITTFSELIDKLITIDIKLYMVLEETGSLAKKSVRTAEDTEKLADLNVKNVDLVQIRSKLKSAIDSKLREAIRSGDTDVLNEVKKYGS